MSVTVGSKRKESGIGETIRVIIHALIIAFVIRTFLFQPFNIPSGSMEQTLLVGDYLFVSKFSYGFSHYSLPWSPRLFSGRIWAASPQPGDVVVFRLPKDDSVDYIKRLIGVPGDRIQMINGVLNINGQPVKREYVDDFIDTDEYGRSVKRQRWHETLPNGVTYTAQYAEVGGPQDNTEVCGPAVPTPCAPGGVYVVPEGHYFMMGDNRDNSTDSRFLDDVGYVPFENLIGRAQIIFFSVAGSAHAWEIWNWPWSVRIDRLLKLVR